MTKDRSPGGFLPMNLNCDYLCAMPSIFKMEFEIGFIETKRMKL